MQYLIGALGGMLVEAFVLFLAGKYAGKFNRELLEYWRVATLEHRQENESLARIADAVTTWEQRYTRRNRKAEHKEA